MKAFWHLGGEEDKGRNFGDVLTPILFDRLLDVRLEWTAVEDAELIAIGSIAGAIPPGWTGTVLGTGKMWEGTGLDLSAARVLALRGALTAADSGASCELLGDLGLLAGQLTHRRVVRHRYGLLAHYADRELGHEAGHRIDILADVDDVIAEASRCMRIVSSSLHGLILADSLGIPNMWRPSAAVLGDGFKFRDYASSFGETIVPNVWRLADPDQVAAKQVALLAAMRASVLEAVR